MKKILMVVVNLITISVFKNPANAQLLNVAANNDSTIIVNSVYAGMLSTTGYNIDEKKQFTSASFRVGGSVTWKIDPKLSLRSWAIVDITAPTKSADAYSIQAVWLQYNPSSTLQVEAGQLGTLTGQQHRGVPASYGGQFETWTQSTFPGVAPTVNIKYLPRKGTMYAVGFSSRAQQPEYQVSVTKGNWKISGFYQDAFKAFGVGFTYTSPNKVFSQTALWKQHGNIASSLNLFLDQKKTVLFYTDFGYNVKASKVIRWEPGLLKVFSMKYVKGLVGLGYAHENQNINAYFYMTL